MVQISIFLKGIDGSQPQAPLVLSSDGHTLYGTTITGGATNSVLSGTIFAINADGTDFTTIYDFSSTTNGGSPRGLMLTNNTLYGVNSACVYSFSLPAPPQLSIVLSGTNVILTWTNTATGFTLQSTTNLLATQWNTDLPAPVVKGSQNTVTNPVSGSYQFYRLTR